MQFIAVEVFICLFDYKALFLCLTDRTCLKMAIPSYCFSIFGSIFAALLSLLIKKFMLGCETIWQSMSKFLWAVWSVSTLLHMDKEEAFLSWKLHIAMIWSFYTFLLDLKIWTWNIWKFSYFNFSHKKSINLYQVTLIYVHPSLLNYPLKYSNRISNIIAR